MPINVCVKKQRTNSYLRSPPSSFLLQGGRALANHPLSCHPQRCVWKPRKGGKMRENGKLEKNEAESLCSKILFVNPTSTVHVLGAL